MNTHICYLASVLLLIMSSINYYLESYDAAMGFCLMTTVYHVGALVISELKKPPKEVIVKACPHGHVDWDKCPTCCH